VKKLYKMLQATDLPPLRCRRAAAELEGQVSLETGAEMKVEGSNEFAVLEQTHDRVVSEMPIREA
jgi:hypothetical protein